MKSLKILHCPTTVGGNAYPLSRAERELGQDSTVLTLDQNYLDYPADVTVFNGGPSLGNEMRRWKWVFRSLSDYNVVHYNFGQTLCPVRLYPKNGLIKKIIARMYNSLYARWTEMLDLIMAHKLGRIVAITYQGDDARQGDYCETHYPIHFCRAVEKGYYSPATDLVKRERIAKVEKYADLIYAVNPDLLNVLPPRAKFIPYSAVNPRDWAPLPASDPLSVPHIVHAPSHRGVKGTNHILSAITRLQEEGVPLHFTLVEKMANADARKVYESADILVDQLLAGFYGALSVELMALAKPVICYIREEDLHFLPEGMQHDMPFINATPDTIYEVLKEWLTVRKADMAEQGRKGRAYIEKWHDPKKVAASLVADYQTIWKQKYPCHS